MVRAVATFLLLLLLIAGQVLTAPAGRSSAETGTPEATPSEPARPPDQPAHGPGGADVAFDGLLAQHFGPQPDGLADPTGYWLFEPTRPRAQAAPGPLPLVLFLHAFDVPSPEWYHVWIDHIVRRGAIVIYPDFQTSGLPFDPAVFVSVDHTAPQFVQAAVRAALAELASGTHARPDLTRMVVVGHSIGTLQAADYAATAAAQGLPVPSALLLTMPGCVQECDVALAAAIPATTRVLVVVGDRDNLAGEDTARRIWANLGHVASDRKDYVRMVSDAHGDPPLVAEHFQPVTTAIRFFGIPGGALDALDWYGTWKWLDALMTCSFADQDCETALGGTPQQRFMGTWSDGVPVATPIVTDDPGMPTP